MFEDVCTGKSEFELLPVTVVQRASYLTTVKSVCGP